MIKPFIWQFQFELAEAPFWQMPLFLEIATENELKYEQRFFWSDNTLITLKGFSVSELALSGYQFEARYDCYLLIDQRNIKLRKKKLHYKPLIEVVDAVYCFGKKVKFQMEKQQHEIITLLNNDSLADERDIPFREALLSTYRHCNVNKESFSLKLQHVEIELSRVIISGKSFYSVLVESSNRNNIHSVVNALGITRSSQDYVSFLREVAC